MRTCLWCVDVWGCVFGGGGKVHTPAGSIRLYNAAADSNMIKTLSMHSAPVGRLPTKPVPHKTRCPLEGCGDASCRAIAFTPSPPSPSGRCSSSSSITRRAVSFQSMLVVLQHPPPPLSFHFRILYERCPMRLPLLPGVIEYWDASGDYSMPKGETAHSELRTLRWIDGHPTHSPYTTCARAEEREGYT